MSEQPGTDAVILDTPIRSIGSQPWSPVAVGDEDLAMLIRLEGRERLARGDSVDLADLLCEIPGLADRRAPLDAAIDVSLRALSGGSRPSPEAVRSLVEAHPDLEGATRDAAALAEALWSTGDLAAGSEPDAARALPAEFGPPLDDGAPRYELVECVGRGTSGEVYRAVDRRLSDEDRSAVVAIKILHGARRDELARYRFAEEASKARRLDHPNVVRVYDRGESPEGEDYIVYEHVGGGDLREWRRARGDGRGAIAVEEAVGLVAMIARGVQAAHSAGLVHLDLKPANVLMTVGGEPRVADFGLALKHDHGDSQACEARETPPVGTYAFMAPEQFRGDDGASAPPADIYAIGGILHWLLTGELPNGSTFDEITSTHRAGVVRREALGRSSRERGFDRDLTAICLRALAPDPADRYDTASGLADDLGAWLRREPIRWTSPGPLRVLRLFARRRPAVFALIVCCVATLVGIAVALETARRFAAVAHANELEARVHAERVDAEREWKAKSSGDYAKLFRNFTEVRRAGLAGEVLTSLWMLEWVHGPAILTDGDNVAKVWAKRIDVVRGLLDERRRDGGVSSLEALQLETLLGFWLTRTGDHTEAEPLLQSNRERWAALLSEDDPWLADVEAMRMCATVNRYAAEVGDGGFAEAERRAIVSVQFQLFHHDKRLETRGDGAQLRLLVLESLREIYGPGLLDDRVRRSWASQRIAELDLSLPNGPRTRSVSGATSATP